jgi:TolB-like protein/tetratricopeptide (TPR) repeat protein
MSDEQPATPSVEADESERKKRKKEEKLRSAWISFVGRIVAQIVGAVATIALGLAVAGRLSGPSGDASKAAKASPLAERRAARHDAPAGRAQPSLAVLPLQNLSADPQQDYFSDGMTEALISSLAKIRGLRVISRTSVMQYKGSKKPLREIAAELGVAALVEGSVMRDGSRVRITAQLIDAASDEHLWTESYDRDVRDVLALQSDVAGAIARQVNVVLSSGEQGRLAPRGTVNPEAFGFYLKGRHAWNRRTEDGFESAIRYFTQSIGEDAKYAAAWAGLADTYSLLAGFPGTGFTQASLPPEEAMALAKSAAEKAIALDDGVAEAHTSLAWVQFRHTWNFAEAERSFQKALELNPGYATAHQWYAVYLGELGRHEEALPEARRALDADPLSPLMHRTLARIHYLARRSDDAESEAREAIELDPASLASQLLLMQILCSRGDFQGAIEIGERVPLAQRNDEAFSLLGYAYACMGQKGRAQDLMKTLLAPARPRRLAPHHLALLHVGLGENDAALRALATAVEQRSGFAVGLKTQPLLDPLRAEPRFQALLRRVGL